MIRVKTTSSPNRIFMQSDTLHIRRQSSVPIYLEIAALRVEKISARLCQPNDQLPFEIKLISLYQANQASGIPIRLAIKRLIAQGVVASQQAKGANALAPTIKLQLEKFKGFYEQIKMQRINPLDRAARNRAGDTSDATAFKRKFPQSNP